MALRASAVLSNGAWHGATRDSVVLGFDDRHRRRMAMCGVRGTAFLLDLAEAVALRGGDALRLDDGSLIEIVAAPEPLAEIGAADAGSGLAGAGSSGSGLATMVRIAWHLGNRHLPTQLVGRKLRIRRDHVIEAMVEGLGGRIVPIEAPFDPEGGAYAGGHGHGHPQGHSHGGGDHHHHQG